MSKAKSRKQKAEMGNPISTFSFQLSALTGISGQPSSRQNGASASCSTQTSAKFPNRPLQVMQCGCRALTLNVGSLFRPEFSTNLFDLMQDTWPRLAKNKEVA